MKWVCIAVVSIAPEVVAEAGGSAPVPPPGMVDLSRGKSYVVTQSFPTEYSFAPLEAKFYVKGSLTEVGCGRSLAKPPVFVRSSAWESRLKFTGMHSPIQL